MTIMQIFLDETGLENQSGAIRLVGLMSSVATWAQVFHPQWVAELNRPPKLRFWHASGANAGELRTDDAEQRPLARHEIAAKQSALEFVLGNNHDKAVSLVVDMAFADWEANVRGKVNPPTKWNKILWPTVAFLQDPVFIIMRETIGHAVGLARAFNEVAFPGDPFQLWIVVEENESKSDLQFQMVIAVEMLRRMVRPALRPVLGPVMFLPSKGPLGHTPLQMADLYAWHVNRMGGLADTSRAEPGWKQLGRITPNGRSIRPDRLKEIVAMLNSGVRLNF